MKKLLFFIPLIAFGAATQAPSNYELLDAQGNVLEIFVATPDVAATYPACVQQIYPTAVSCVLAPIQPTVDIAPVVTTNAVSPVITTNNAVVTTNNIAP
jgi:hypothetical protein